MTTEGIVTYTALLLHFYPLQRSSKRLLDGQEAAGLRGDFAPVGHTEAGNPKEATRGIGDDPRGGFAVGGEVGVGEEVGHQFGALHAEGVQAVALAPVAAGEGQLDLVKVEELAVR